MKKNFLLLLLLPIAIHTNAQMPGGLMGGGGAAKIYDGKISGNVIDATTNKYVEFANVALYKMTDTIKPIDGTVTDEKGAFKLKDIKLGKYRVAVSFIGYKNHNTDSIVITDKKPVIELGKILMQPNSKLLKEATIVEEAPLIENQIDKLVYNASKDLTVKGGNAADVLRNVPMVTVDLDGNVELRGTQNIRVLINNKPSNIMAASVADALKMIPADEIDKVEVITSPSAKYDAEGTGGIINIITKRKTMQGMSGSVNVGAGTRSSNLFGNINYREGRFGIGANVGGFGYFGNGNLNAQREDINPVVNSYLKQQGPNTILGVGPYAQLTSDYDINSKNSLNASFKLSGMLNHTTSEIDNSLSFDASNYEAWFTNNTDVKTNRLGYDANLDYKRTFAKPDEELTMSAQLTNNNSNTNYYVFHDSVEVVNYQEKSVNEGINREATFQADYVYPFSKKATLETGMKAILRNVNSNYTYQFFDYSTNEYVSDPALDNIFDYDQNIYAGYLQGSTTFKRWGFKAGLRYEFTDIYGNFQNATNNPPINTDYQNYIPSATVSYTKSGKFSTKFSYTQRIQRPSITFLNPYINQSDPTNISYGNPDLDPERSQSFELGYSLFRKFGSINASVYHRFTNNAIESIRFVDTNQVYNTTYANLGQNTTTGASISANIISKQKLIIGGNFNIYYYTVNADTIDLENSGINYNISIFGSYKFNKTWAVQAFGNFNGPKYSLQGKTTSFFFYNASVKREFKNEKGSFGLGLDNFLSPYLKFKSEYSGPGFNFQSTNKFFFLGVRVSFEYRFGKVEFTGGKKKKIKNDDLKQGEEGGMGGMGGGK
jgi:outer membrane receptor protein involved in Fe transport